MPTALRIGPYRFYFDCHIQLEFHPAKVTSDAGLWEILAKEKTNNKVVNEVHAVNQ